jgi:hypothetical protein
MTSYEISEFVQQRAPRKVPRDVFRAANRRTGINCKYLANAFVFLFISILYYIRVWMEASTRLPVESIELVIPFLFFLSAGILFITYWYNRRGIKHLLAEGLFVTGLATEVKLWQKGRRWTADIADTYKVIVSFSDQYGATQAGRYLIEEHDLPTCSQWADEKRSVGLLYLPNRQDVLITDLWEAPYQ